MIGILVILVAVMLPALARAKGISGRGSCAKNLKQWGTIFHMYAVESPGGKYPLVNIEPTPDWASVKAAAAPHILSLWLAYFTDPSLLVCPMAKSNDVGRYLDDSGVPDFNSLKTRLRAGDSYSYIGWTLDRCNDDDPSQKLKDLMPLLTMAGAPLPPLDIEESVAPLQLVRALFGLVQLGMDDLSAGVPVGQVIFKYIDADLGVGDDDEGKGLGNGGSRMLFRLRQDLRSVVAEGGGDPDAPSLKPSEVFVMFDKISGDKKEYNHQPAGSNVLYLDGHVEYRRFPGKAPLTKGAARLLGILDR